MIRLGDAEAFGFETDRVGQAVLAADRERRARIWWGHSVADEQVYRSVASPFVDAVMDADLLGVPNIFRLLRDMELVGDKGSLEELSTTARSLVIIFDSLKRHVQEKRLTIEAKILVDERCHERLFSPDNTRKFIAAAERTVVISCYSQDNISAGLEAPIDAHIEIPPHNQIRSRLGKDDPSEPSMLQDFPRLLAEVERRIKPGDLVLVAAGFLGKILIHAAKKKGGVALDCGAAADYWIGMKTRLSSDFIWR